LDRRAALAIFSELHLREAAVAVLAITAFVHAMDQAVQATCHVVLVLSPA
jgi:hypothetical protein